MTSKNLMVHVLNAQGELLWSHGRDGNGQRCGVTSMSHQKDGTTDSIIAALSWATTQAASELAPPISTRWEEPPEVPLTDTAFEELNKHTGATIRKAAEGERLLRASTQSEDKTEIDLDDVLVVVNDIVRYVREAYPGAYNSSGMAQAMWLVMQLLVGPRDAAVILSYSVPSLVSR